MDIISEVRLLVDDMELPNKVFGVGLSFKGKPNKTYCKYEMDSHCQVLVYSDYDMFRQPPASVNLVVGPEKVEKVAKILKEAGVKTMVYNEKVGNGIVNTLEWSIGNGAYLSLESFEDGYWDK